MDDETGRLNWRFGGNGKEDMSPRVDLECFSLFYDINDEFRHALFFICHLFEFDLFSSHPKQNRSYHTHTSPFTLPKIQTNSFTLQRNYLTIPFSLQEYAFSSTAQLFDFHYHRDNNNDRRRNSPSLTCTFDGTGFNSMAGMQHDRRW